MMFNHWIHYGPPNYPFAINRYSTQSRDLVGWWPGVNNFAYRDYTGNNENGVFSGDSTQIVSDPVLGFGAFFGGSGTDDSITIADNSKLDIAESGGFSISCWLRFNATSNLSPRFLHKSSSDNGFILLLLVNSNRLQFLVRQGGTQYRVRTNSIIFEGVMYHICTTFDTSQNQKIFIDGQEVAINSSSIAMANSTDLIIGGSSFSQKLGGVIGDVRLYNRLLQPNEVYQLYDPQTRWQLYKPLIKPLGVVISTPTPPTPPTGPTSFDRLYNVPAEDRIYEVPEERSRIYNVPAEDRIYEV